MQKFLMSAFLYTFATNKRLWSQFNFYYCRSILSAHVPSGGYEANLISTIVDLGMTGYGPNKGYEANLISTIVDNCWVFVNFYEAMKPI